ncbi:MAG: hypothetical protein EBU46_14310 [Nitrosomonadaceae bacterium]|nr:hypothetical protein [Nitrosomonadaceae bacterium]
MRVLVAGDYKKRILLDTKKATAVLIMTDDGKPNVIFKMLDNGRGWIRLTEGEDQNFSSVATELGLT